MVEGAGAHDTMPCWPAWLAPPADGLGRVRWATLLASLAAVVVLVPPLVVAVVAAWEPQALAGAAVVWLGGRWVAIYRAGRVATGWTLLEALGLLTVGVVTASPAASAVLLAGGLAFRSLYGSARDAAIGAMLYGAAFIAGLALTPVAWWVVPWPALALGGSLGGLAGALALHAVATSLAQSSAAQAEMRRLHAELEARLAAQMARLETINQELRAEVTAQRQTETALRESEARYRAALAASPEATLLLDPLAHVTLCNQRAVALLGYASDAEIAGRSVFEFVAPTGARRVAADLRQALTGDAVTRGEHPLRHRDGSAVPAAVSAAAMRDDAGHVRGFVLVARPSAAHTAAAARPPDALRAEGRLEGVVMASREMGHLLNNDLGLALGALEALEQEPDLSAATRALLADIKEGLSAAGDHVRQFQQVARVAVKDTPVGPALDLERSVREDVLV